MEVYSIVLILDYFGRREIVEHVEQLDQAPKTSFMCAFWIGLECIWMRCQCLY